MVLRVEHDDTKFLALEPAHLQDQPIRDVVRPADRPARHRPVGEETTTEFERGHQLCRLGLPDPTDRHQFEFRRPGKAGQAVVAGQGIGGEVNR